MNSAEYLVKYKYKRRSLEDVCQWFSNQEDAIQCSYSIQNSKVFAYEVSESGQRNYVTSSASAFWDFYRKLPLEKKNHYEVLVDGCTLKLFFDLEFSKENNSEKDGPKMVEYLLTAVNDRIKEKYNIKSGLNDVLSLDSSSSEKFSCHLIFQRCLFQNIEKCKDFVMELLDSLKMKEDHLLKVQDKEGNSKLFIDLSVYSRNRHFRLLGSSKFGEIRPLSVSSYGLMPTPGGKKTPSQSRENFDSQEYEKNVFLNSLIANVCQDKDVRIINFDQVQAVRVSTAAPAASAGGHSKICTTVPSPNEIDNIVAELVRPGTIRKVSFIEDAETFRYDIRGQKFCKKIGREHSSNNIFYIYYKRHQKLFQDCYSPACSNLDTVEIDLKID